MREKFKTFKKKKKCKLEYNLNYFQHIFSTKKIKSSNCPKYAKERKAKWLGRIEKGSFWLANGVAVRGAGKFSYTVPHGKNC